MFIKKEKKKKKEKKVRLLDVSIIPVWQIDKVCNGNLDSEGWSGLGMDETFNACATYRFEKFRMPLLFSLTFADIGNENYQPRSKLFFAYVFEYSLCTSTSLLCVHLQVCFACIFDSALCIHLLILLCVHLQLCFAYIFESALGTSSSLLCVHLWECSAYIFDFASSNILVSTLCTSLSPLCQSGTILI